jgi:hypothetical protein
MSTQQRPKSFAATTPAHGLVRGRARSPLRAAPLVPLLTDIGASIDHVSRS